MALPPPVPGTEIGGTEPEPQSSRHTPCAVRSLAGFENGGTDPEPQSASAGPRAVRPVAGIEIGGTKLQLGIGDGNGTLLALERLAVDPSRRAGGILRQIEAAFPRLLEKAGLESGRLGALGIGFGGPVRTEVGRVQKSYQIEGWNDFPLVAWATERLSVPCSVLANDADAAGLAECRFGAGRGYSPVLYITVGSGIGGALILDDRIYRGAGCGATEIGHLRVPVGTSPQSGMRELEQVASGWAIASAARELAMTQRPQDRSEWIVLASAGGDPSKITAASVAEAASAGDGQSRAILETARTAFAFALTQVIALLAPRRIVIGGGVSQIGDLDWFEPIRRMTEQDVFPPFRGQYDIVSATLGEEVVVHGALAIARDAVPSGPP
jgi:glucokinase